MFMNAGNISDDTIGSNLQLLAKTHNNIPQAKYGPACTYAYGRGHIRKQQKSVSCHCTAAKLIQQQFVSLHIIRQLVE